MKKNWSVAWTALATVGLIAVVALALLASGTMNVGADVKPGVLEETLAPWSRDRSVEQHAPKARDPYLGDPNAIAAGMDHYRENCLVCHGAPGLPLTEISEGLNPPAPALGDLDGGTTDGELFWATKHGIRFTAMPAFGPTHSDHEIWEIVAFLHHLRHLTAAEKDFLREGLEGEERHEERSSRARPHDLGNR